MERREPRGALAATIDIGGAALHVLATHLGLRVHERRFQVRQILDYLESVRDTLVVVLGDFNDWLPGRSAAHVLDHRLGRPPRPATYPVAFPIVALTASGAPATRASRRVRALNARRAARVRSSSRRRRDPDSWWPVAHCEPPTWQIPTIVLQGLPGLLADDSCEPRGRRRAPGAGTTSVHRAGIRPGRIAARAGRVRNTAHRGRDDGKSIIRSFPRMA